ncbi:MAG TPA: saccharopine dehydrogenase C-terminal domain-containing protein, partial [Gemmatimonadaceae bacterium]|nr:saccharopine dehydrogenase C-terminal domain-containing protein [Gemmatimonadaceae bacterium]
KLTKPGAHDLVALRIVVEGKKAGQPARRAYEMVDRFDPKLGISAMMRTTGYSLSITGQMQARGEIPPGVHTPDEAVPGDGYIAELAKRGIEIRQTS